MKIDFMLKTYLLSLCVLCNVLIVKSQDKPSTGFFNNEKISFGGNFGLGFGSITYVNASPMIGYRLTERLTTGVGAIYSYTHYAKEIYGQAFSTSVLGGSAFARYRVLDNIYGIAEFQTLSLNALDPFTNRNIRVPADVLFLGAGYLSQISPRAYVNFAVLFDVIEDVYSPYTNPVIQAGIIINP